MRSREVDRDCVSQNDSVEESVFNLRKDLYKMQILKRMIFSIGRRIGSHASEMRKRIFGHYGYFALAVLITVIFKNIMFYIFMDVSNYFIPVLAVTCIFIFILFSAFKNKWIPAAIYMAWSLFMFGDVLYHKYFNASLSIKLLNSVKLLADVTSSIEGVIKPQYFLVFIDNIAIFAMLIYSARKQKKCGEKKIFHEKKYTKAYDYRKMANVFISVMLIGYIVINPFCTDAMSSISTQEELSSHIRDLFGTNEISSETEYYLSTGSYEKSLVKAGVASAEDYADTDIDFEDVDTENTDDGKDADKDKDKDEDKAENEDKSKDEDKAEDSEEKDKDKDADAAKDADVKDTDDEKDADDDKKADSESTDDAKDEDSEDANIAKDSDSNDSSLSDETIKSLFGAGEGRNLIVIQLEAFQNFAINMEYNGQELTPFLNDLIGGDDTLYFDHYYYQIGSGNTSDAEFATLNSLFGTLESYTYTLYNHNYYNGLPSILDNLGYDTAVMHAYDRTFWNRMNMYPSLGFKHYFDDDYYEEDSDYKGWNVVSVNDVNFFSQSVEAMKTLDEPFSTFMITLSGHHPFSQKSSNCKIKLSKPEKGTIVGDYFNTVRYVDHALETLFDELKEAGLYENSVICLYGDHYGLSCTDSDIKKMMSNLLGEDYGYKWHFNIPLIINIPGSGVSETISTAGGQLDFLPTISYIMGIKRLDTLYLGQNLITAEEGFVPIQQFLSKGSFINDDVVFFFSESGVYSTSLAWDVKTGKQTSIDGYKDLVQASETESDLSQFYLENDAIDAYVNDGATIEDILNDADSKEEESMPSVISRPIDLDTYEVISHRERDYQNDAMSSVRKSYENGVRCMEIAAAPDDIYDSVIDSRVMDESGYIYNSKTLMKYSDVAAILNEYDDLSIIVRMVNDKNESFELSKKNDYKELKVLYEDFSDCMEEHDADMSRCIIKTDNTDMYLAAVKAGSEKNVLCSYEIDDYSESEWKDFFMASKPWALFLSSDITESEYSLVEDGDCPIYIVSWDVWEKTESESEKEAMDMTGALGRVVNYVQAGDAEYVINAGDTGNDESASGSESASDSESASGKEADKTESIIAAASNGKNPAMALAIVDVAAAFAAFLTIAGRYASRKIRNECRLKKSLK